VSRIVVTGARGFAGSHMVELLSTGGVPVIAWGREDVDLLDRTAVARALAAVRPTVVYHCAGAAHVGQSISDSRDTLAKNVLGTHHVLDGLRSADIAARVLITGSSLVYRQSTHALKEDDPIGPATPYALSKLAQEMLGTRSIHEDRQQVFLVRSFNHTGPRQQPSYAAPAFARQIALIERGRIAPEILVGNLDAARDLHDVRDTVRAYRDVVAHGTPGTVYNVCSGRAVPIREVLDRLAAMSRVPVTVTVDRELYRPNDNPMLLGDRGRIEREIGWHPVIPLEQTLTDLLAYWRKELQ
jgi:GDP-4-dehydro-6-deoxy-D-mannose reductase